MSRLLPVGIAVCCALLVVACDLGTPQQAHVRIAHFVPDAPAVDFCFKPATDAAYSTPFVGNSGLDFTDLSNRSDMDAGTYSVRVIPGGSGNCNTSLNGLGDISNILFAEGGAYTLAAIGRLTGTGQGSLALNAYPDDLNPIANQVKLRYVHVAPEVDSVDIGAISGNTFFPQVSNLVYPGTSNPAYVTYNQPGLVGAIFAAVSPTGSNNVIVQGGNQGVTVPSSSVSTLWLVGRPNVVGDARLSFVLSADDTNSSQRFP